MFRIIEELKRDLAEVEKNPKAVAIIKEIYGLNGNYIARQATYSFLRRRYSYYKRGIEKEIFNYTSTDEGEHSCYSLESFKEMFNIQASKLTRKIEDGVKEADVSKFFTLEEVKDFQNKVFEKRISKIKKEHSKKTFRVIKQYTDKTLENIVKS